jgi:hypothetical protein
MPGARFPSKSGAADRCRFVTVGGPDTVRCTPDSPVPPADRWSKPRVARGFGGRPLRWRPLAHRTVRCTTGQFGELWLYAAEVFSRVASSPELVWRTGHCPVHHRTLSSVPDRAESWLLQPSPFLFLFSLILALRQTSLVSKTNELSLETYLRVDLHFIHHMAYNNPLNLCWTLRGCLFGIISCLDYIIQQILN